MFHSPCCFLLCLQTNILLSPVPNVGKDRNGICKSWGQHHFETFDGIYYYFPGNCSYIFVKDCSDPEPQYTVWVRSGLKWKAA